MTDFNITKEVILYAQNGDVYTGTRAAGFTKVDASALTPTKAYHLNQEISVTAAYGAWWLVDGQNSLRKIDMKTGVITQPAASAGSIPQFGGGTYKYARLTWLYRGRLFHGRFQDDAQNYYASYSGDPLNYDTGDKTQKGAFAANDTDQSGLLGDVLTAAIPYGDVACVIGMANRIDLMRGDPKAGGSIVNLSREIGIVSPTAWCRDPEGGLYFMARDGLYTLGNVSAAGMGEPKRLSKGRLDTTLGRIDHSQVRIAMVWDPLEWGLKVFLIPAATGGITKSVFWSPRKDDFWIDTMASNIAPTAAASAPKHGYAVLGCRDGQLRVMDPTAIGSDDGSPIDSQIDLTGPLQLLGPMVNAKVVEARFQWGSAVPAGQFNVNYSLRGGDDAMSANTASPFYTQNITAGGYQSLDRTRSRAACVIYRLFNATINKAWQYEKGMFLFAPSGRVRT